MVIRPFERDEAVLLWLFALVLEGVLPATMGPKRHREMAAIVDEQVLRRDLPAVDQRLAAGVGRHRIAFAEDANDPFR